MTEDPRYFEEPLFEVHTEQDLRFIAEYEKRLAPIRKIFDSYTPEGEEVIVPGYPDTPFTPRLAHELRDRFGGNALDDTPLVQLVQRPEIKGHFPERLRRALGTAFGKLNYHNIHTVGELRDVTTLQLFNIVGVSDVGKVFIQTAFKKIEPPKK